MIAVTDDRSVDFIAINLDDDHEILVFRFPLVMLELDGEDLYVSPGPVCPLTGTCIAWFDWYIAFLCWHREDV